MKLSGLRAQGGRAARLRIYATDISRTLFEQDIDAPEDQPITIEFRAHLPAGKHLIRIVNAVPWAEPRGTCFPTAQHSKPVLADGGPAQPWQIKLTDDEREAHLADHPPGLPGVGRPHAVESWPTPAHQRIFFNGGRGRTSGRRPTPGKSSRQVRFTRAFRRPVRPAELDRLVRLLRRVSVSWGTDFEVVGQDEDCSPSFARTASCSWSKGSTGWRLLRLA